MITSSNPCQETKLPPILEWEQLRFDPNHYQLKYNNQLLQLTPKEYALLELLLRSNSRLLSRRAILDNLWEFEDSPEEETVKAHVRGLCSKLKNAGAPANFIENICRCDPALFGFGKVSQGLLLTSNF